MTIAVAQPTAATARRKWLLVAMADRWNLLMSLAGRGDEFVVVDRE
jgi:hypothetical protein